MEKERTFRVVWCDVLGVRTYSETHFSGGGGYVDTGAFRGVHGRIAPITSTTVTYQMVRIREKANPTKPERIRKIPLHSLTVVEGQELGVVLHEFRNNPIVAYINGSTRGSYMLYDYASSEAVSHSDDRVKVFLVSIPLLFLVGAKLSWLLAVVLCFLIWFCLYRLKLVDGKPSYMEQDIKRVCALFLTTDKNVIRIQPDGAVNSSVETAWSMAS